MDRKPRSKPANLLFVGSIPTGASEQVIVGSQFRAQRHCCAMGLGAKTGYEAMVSLNPSPLAVNASDIRRASRLD